MSASAFSLLKYHMSCGLWNTTPGGTSGKEPTCQYRRLKSRGMIPWSSSTAAHSSFLAWRILWTEEPGGLQSMGLQRVRPNWSDLAHKHAHQWENEAERENHVLVLLWDESDLRDILKRSQGPLRVPRSHFETLVSANLHSQEQGRGELECEVEVEVKKCRPEQEAQR